MTTIDFYTHCADPLKIAIRIVAKAWAQHGSVRIVTADDAMTATLDSLLWQWPATGFMPHCRLESALAADTPILVDHAAEHRGPTSVLVNLQPAPPSFFARFERVAEIVGDDAQSVAAGRERWKYYKERGYDLRSHNLGDRA